VVFKRRGTRRLYFQAKTETGYRQLSTGTSNRILAQKIAGMWERLAEESRAWDLLTDDRSPAELWDLWQATGGNVAEMRRRLADVDLEPLVAPWLHIYRQRTPKNARLTELRVRALLPPGQPVPRSTVTVGWLTERLYAYAGQASTLRGVASAWSLFFEHCTRVHGLFEWNPMARVVRPIAAAPVVRFYELDTVERIVGAQPDAQRRAVMAIAYGTGIESGTTLRLTRADLQPADREIYAPGTKTHTRQRVARVSAWAWPHIWAYAKDLLPTARLFPVEWGSETLSYWHRETVKALGLAERLKLHAARHHWACTALRAGVPLEVVRRQLGHSTPVLTLKTYGAFIPAGDDRERWERVVEVDLARRREAQ
jgi:integrase